MPNMKASMHLSCLQISEPGLHTKADKGSVMGIRLLGGACMRVLMCMDYLQEMAKVTTVLTSIRQVTLKVHAKSWSYRSSASCRSELAKVKRRKG